MKTIYSLVFLCLLFLSTSSQPIQFELAIEEQKQWDKLPVVQSFVLGIDSLNRWLIIGGRTDGLHKRIPFESFLTSGNNTTISVFNP